MVPAAGQRPRRHRRGRDPRLRHPHRDLRPDARRRSRHQDRPRQLQPGAVHLRPRLGQLPRHRPAGPQHAGPPDRRLPDHPVRRDPRRGDLRDRRLGDRHVGRLLPRLARDRRDARRRRHHELPVAAARGRRPLRVLAQRREHRSGAGDHPHPGLPAHRPRRVRRAAEPAVRRRRPHLRRSRPLHHLPPRPADRAADTADRRDAGLLLRHAGGELAELPGHRHPAARRQLGPDGRRRAAPTCTPRGGCRSSPAWPSSSPPCRPPSWRPGPASPPIPGSGGA